MGEDGHPAFAALVFAPPRRMLLSDHPRHVQVWDERQQSSLSHREKQLPFREAFCYDLLMVVEKEEESKGRKRGSPWWPFASYQPHTRSHRQLTRAYSNWRRRAGIT